MPGEGSLNNIMRVLFGLGLAASLSAVTGVRAETPEPGLASSPFGDELPWGACPAFMPKGCQLAVLHGTPDQDNADVYFKVPAKSSIPLHRHSSPRRMILVAGEMRITYEGQETMTLKPGHYAYAPAKRAHDGYCASRTSCILFIAFESPLDPKPTVAASAAE